MQDNATFYDYATEYYRVNNSHDGFISAFKVGDETVTAVVDTEGKTLTIKIPGTGSDSSEDDAEETSTETTEAG